MPRIALDSSTLEVSDPCAPYGKILLVKRASTNDFQAKRCIPDMKYGPDFDNTIRIKKTGILYPTTLLLGGSIFNLYGTAHPIE